VQTRMVKLDEAKGMLGFLLVGDDALVVEDDAVTSLNADAPAVLDAAVAELASLGEWSSAAIEAALRSAVVEGLGIKAKFAFGPLRVAATGRRVSPPLFESLEILGRTSSLARLSALRARLG
jgi:glutamyl-tRNA synthetase